MNPLTMPSMARITAAWVLVAVAAATLGGCYESPKAKVYKPGDYKGTKDPLLSLSKEPQHQRALRERFDLVQRDR